MQAGQGYAGSLAGCPPQAVGQAAAHAKPASRSRSPPSENLHNYPGPPAPTAPQPTPGRHSLPPTLGAVCQRLARSHAGLLRCGYRQALLIQLGPKPLQVKLCMERGWGEWRHGGGGVAAAARAAAGGLGARSRCLACLLIASHPAHPSSRPAPRWAAPPAPPGRQSSRPGRGASCGSDRRPPWRSYSPRGLGKLMLRTAQHS